MKSAAFYDLFWIEWEAKMCFVANHKWSVMEGEGSRNWTWYYCSLEFLLKYITVFRAHLPDFYALLKAKWFISMVGCALPLIIEIASLLSAKTPPISLLYPDMKLDVNRGQTQFSFPFPELWNERKHYGESWCFGDPWWPHFHYMNKWIHCIHYSAITMRKIKCFQIENDTYTPLLTSMWGISELTVLKSMCQL